jgi:hypothetical protein
MKRGAWEVSPDFPDCPLLRLWGMLATMATQGRGHDTLPED